MNNVLALGWQGQLGRKGVKSSMKAEVVQSEAKFKQVACGEQLVSYGFRVSVCLHSA